VICGGDPKVIIMNDGAKQFIAILVGISTIVVVAKVFTEGMVF
jgi:hypothetical protein